MGGLGLGLQLQLQMTWQPSLLSQKRQTAPPLGLRNLGNSCYLNSVLQCLTYTPPLANFCLRFQHSSLCDSVTNGERKRECPFCILEKRIVRSLSLNVTLDAPAKIQRSLRIFSEHFRCGRQEDAHEFLRFVIDACHNTCLRLKKLRRPKGNDSTNGSGNTVVREIFGGALQSQVKCLSCNCESNKVDEIMDISLDVLHSNSVREALQKFFQPEILDGNNKYKCENCKKLVAARKQMSVLQAPNILVIQLKRFEGVFCGKIDKAIAFDEVLVLSSFMCKASQDPQPEYTLFGTIVHAGYSPESGHYYAYIKDALGRWYCCNDSYVTLSTLQDVLSEKVYILFFSRTNQKPASATTTFASNGLKSHESNDSGASESPKASIPMKTVPTKPYFEQPSRKDILVVSKVDKVPSSSRVKFNIFGNAGPKRAVPVIDGKVDACKSQNREVNGVVKDYTRAGKHGNDMPSTRNGLDKIKGVDTLNNETCTVSSLGSENGCTQADPFHSVMPHLKESNGSICSVVEERRHNHLEFQNGVVNGQSDIPGLKRKINEDSCILFAQDAQSRAKIEELKKILNKEADLVLRSCGWYEKVYSFMYSRKRLCAQEDGNSMDASALKKFMIADAKPTFIPQIPEALKLELVKHLQSFSGQK